MSDFDQFPVLIKNLEIKKLITVREFWMFFSSLYGTCIFLKIITHLLCV